MIIINTVRPVEKFRPYFVVKRFGFVHVFRDRRSYATHDNYQQREREPKSNRGVTHRGKNSARFVVFYSLAGTIGHLPDTPDGATIRTSTGARFRRPPRDRTCGKINRGKKIKLCR